MRNAIKPRLTWSWAVLGLALATSASAVPKEPAMPESLIDDFSQDRSALGTSWEGFTDRVMGGKSDMSVGYRSEAGQRYLSMSGTVSLENNGGFIQARLPLAAKGRPSFDATDHSGLRLVVRGTGSDYYVFLRTSGNVLPWSFFMAALSVTGDWQEVLIPWSEFKKGDYGSFFALNPAKLTSVAVVAYKKAFTASLDVKSISFF